MSKLGALLSFFIPFFASASLIYCDAECQAAQKVASQAHNEQVLYAIAVAAVAYIFFIVALTLFSLKGKLFSKILVSIGAVAVCIATGVLVSRLSDPAFNNGLGLVYPRIFGLEQYTLQIILGELFSIPIVLGALLRLIKADDLSVRQRARKLIWYGFIGAVIIIPLVFATEYVLFPPIMLVT